MLFPKPRSRGISPKNGTSDLWIFYNSLRSPLVKPAEKRCLLLVEWGRACVAPGDAALSELAAQAPVSRTLRTHVVGEGNECPVGGRG